MSVRNPPEKSPEERAGQASGRLRGVLESRLASQRKFFSGPTAGPSSGSSQGPEVPDEQVGGTATAEGPPESPQPQSPAPAAIAASDHVESSKKSSLAMEPPQEWSPSLATGPQIEGEESSIKAAAPGEEIKNSEKQQPAAAARTEAPESSHPYRGLERRGSFRYKVEYFEVLFVWRQAAGSVTTGSVGTVNGSGAAGSKAMRGPEATSLPADFDHYEARVHDISQTGVCLVVDRLPPDNRDLWVGLKGTQPIVWSPVILRSLSEPHPGCFMLRLSFKESCPYELFKLAVTYKGDVHTAT